MERKCKYVKDKTDSLFKCCVWLTECKGRKHKLGSNLLCMLTVWSLKGYKHKPSVLVETSSITPLSIISTQRSSFTTSVNAESVCARKHKRPVRESVFMLPCINSGAETNPVLNYVHLQFLSSAQTNLFLRG